ncbi:MAG: hypothetical protein U0869_06430 [Chloroflexota bacterium]
MQGGGGSRWRRGLATAGLAVALAMAAVAVVLLVVLLGGAATLDEVGSLTGSITLGASYAVLGWLVAWQRSRNPLGWVYLGIGVSQIGVAFAALGSVYGVSVAPGSIPFAELLTWASLWAWAPGLILLVSLSLLLFPDGRLPSRRWRPVAWLALGAVLLLAVPSAVGGWPMRFADPLAAADFSPTGLMADLANIGGLLIPVVAALSVLSLVVRFWRSGGRERLQLKWFTVGAVPVIGFVVIAGLLPFVPGLVWLVAAFVIVPILPAAIGVAILRHQLLGIDRVISRTIAYSVVTVVLGGVFVAVSLVLQALLEPVTSGGTVAVAVSTLAVYALFQPVLRGVRRVVDRRFDRRRYDVDRTAEAFAGRLRDEVDLDALGFDLVRTAESSLAPASIGLWVRGG